MDWRWSIAIIRGDSSDWAQKLNAFDAILFLPLMSLPRASRCMVMTQIAS